MSDWPTIRAEIPGILGLSIPIVVGLGASTLLGVTDSVMLAPLGPVPLAAVGLTMAVATLIFLVFATMQIADGVQSTMLGALRGMSDTGWPALVSIIAYWGGTAAGVGVVRLDRSGWRLGRIFSGAGGGGGGADPAVSCQDRLRGVPQSL